MEPYPYRSFWASLNPIQDGSPEPKKTEVTEISVSEPPEPLVQLAPKGTVVLPPNSIIIADDHNQRPLFAREDLIAIGTITAGIFAMAFVCVAFSR
jgi:hypothetical protein